MLTRADLERMKLEPSNVACGKCRACCKDDTVILSRKDDLSAYRWHLEGGVPVLDRKLNGECVYLGPKGCTIHPIRPDVCRRFDCGVAFMLTTPAQRREDILRNGTMAEVYAAGKRRAKTLGL